MENPFKKIFETETEEEMRKRLEGLQQKLEGLKLWMNDWIVDDRREADRLERNCNA